MRLLLAAVWLAVLACPAAAWRVTSRGAATALALDAGGGVVAAGIHPGLFPVPSFEVTRLTAGGGRRWRFRGALGVPRAVAVDSAGDVVVAGEEREASAVIFAVLKLDHRNGRELWRTELSDGTGRGLAIAPGGDAIVAGTSAGAFAVARLSGSSGAVLWLRTLDAPGPAAALALAPGGDVVACGGDAVWRLAGDGTERWRVTLPGDDAAAVALAADGDALIASTSGFTIVRLAAADGAPRWRATSGGAAATVALDSTGNVLAGGRLDGRFAVAQLDGTSGAERWRQTLGDGGPDDGAAALALDGGGNVAATGVATRIRTGRVFAVASFGGATGALRWERLLDGTARAVDPDGGVAVAVDRRGRVAVSGTIGAGVSGIGRDQRSVVLRLPAR